MRFLAAFALLAATAITPAQAERPIAFAANAPRTGTLVLPLRNVEHLGHAANVLDQQTSQAVANALASADFQFEANEVLTLRGIGRWSKIVVIGTGPARLAGKTIQELGGTAMRETLGDKAPVTILTQTFPDAGPDAGVQLATGAALGGYSFDRYKFVDPATPRSPEQDAPLTIVTGEGGAAERFRQQGEALAGAVSFARDLINEPANVVYPETFVERTRTAFRGVRNVSIEVLDVPAMERLGMGSILSVGRGSARPPRMLVVEYRGAPGAPIVMAGKGITFDSGGISLKPGSGMWEMKGDMSGAAAVVGAALSLAKSGAPVHVVAIAALAENMPGGSATRPGDVVKAYNGKTIEILNTDAEGRLVLADAVSYGERKYRPAAIVDLATLTGAKVTALGDEYAGLFSRHDALADQLEAAGEATGEALWRLPLHENYGEDMKSKVADIKNVVEGGGPGAGLGAQFIGYFVDGPTPWAHLDIAGNELADGPYALGPAGAIGFGVRLLDRFARDFRPVATQN